MNLPTINEIRQRAAGPTTVNVKYRGHIIKCVVAGFANPYATVYDRTDEARRWEFSWDAVRRAISNNRALRA